MPHIGLVAICAALAVPTLACSADAPKTHTPDTPPPASSLETTVTKSAPDSLRVQLVLPRRVRAGERMSITLRVENRTLRAITLYLRGRTATFDVIIAHPDGAIVWRRLEDEIIPAIVSVRTLAPSEQLKLETVWDQRTKKGKTVPPGEYTAHALLLVEDNPPQTPSVTFRIVEK